MIKITFLGTSAGVPTRFRNVSGLALQMENDKSWMLFDCGEGTQHQLLKTSLSAYNLSKIFITHLHGDHVYGIFGMLASRGMQQSLTPLTIYGPKGIKKLISCVMEQTQLHLPFDMRIIEIEGGEHLDFDTFRIEVVPLSHSIASYGFVLIESDKQGKFDVDRARSMKIPEGPLYARLKRGETVMLDDGRLIDGNTLVGDKRAGKKIIIGGDNDKPMLFSKYKNIDLMIHESTYMQKDFDNLPRKFRHSTAKKVAIAASKMGVKRLILTHISPRYDANERILELLNEAKSYYKADVSIAEDFMQVTV